MCTAHFYLLFSLRQANSWAKWFVRRGSQSSPAPTNKGLTLSVRWTPSWCGQEKKDARYSRPALTCITPIYPRYSVCQSADKKTEKMMPVHISCASASACACAQQLLHLINYCLLWTQELDGSQCLTLTSRNITKNSLVSANCIWNSIPTTDTGHDPRGHASLTERSLKYLNISNLSDKRKRPSRRLGKSFLSTHRALHTLANCTCVTIFLCCCINFEHSSSLLFYFL